MEKKFSRNHLTVLLKQVNFMICKLHPNKAVKKKIKGVEGKETALRILIWIFSTASSIISCLAFIPPKADFTAAPPTSLAVSSCSTSKEMQT